jgi:cytochrome c-type biogenesis protein CcmH
MKKIALILILSTFPFHLYAVNKNPIEFDNAEQEKRCQELTEELRCVVCQNQSVADSNAELAQDLRDLVCRRIIDGQSDQQITDFLVERYGDFVLYDPPLQPKTYILWVGPLVLVLLAFVMLLYFIRRHAQSTTTPPTLTEEEQHKIKQELTKNTK